jgi:hypothetical protein
VTLIDLSPYLGLILIGFLPNEIWRSLGVIVAHGLDEDAEVLVWVRAVATAVLAGVVSQLIFTAPPGALGTIPLPVRLAAMAAGLAGYFGGRRSLFAGVVCGEIVLVGGGWYFGG